MARMSSHHQQLTDGVGKCSVPMWCGGLPAGFCDEPAYGSYIKGETLRTYTGELIRVDGKYAGYVPGLACPAHGGPAYKVTAEYAHSGDPCKHCGTPQDKVKPGPCPERVGA